MYTLQKFRNTFPYIEVQNDAASAKIALQGGHVFSFSRDGEENLLWVSYASDFKEGKAIRGGVPICWPAFGMNNPDLPQHGFARTMMWDFISSKDINTSTTEVILQLQDTEQSRLIWNYSFTLRLKIIVCNTLTMELETVNTSKNDFVLTQAFHSYFKVSNISNIQIKGLENKAYLETLKNEVLIQEGAITFKGEVDSVYQEVDSDIYLKDKERTICLKNSGASSVVIWNPWIEKTKRMSAMNEEDYLEFVCIETANAFEDFKVLKPKQAHTIKVTIS